LMFERKFEEEITTLSEKPEAKLKSSFRLHFFAFLALMSVVWLAALLFLATGFEPPPAAAACWGGFLALAGLAGEACFSSSLL